MPRAIVIGSSAGIGLATARRLADAGWDVAGVARRDAGLAHARYRHVVGDVTAAGYRAALAALLDDGPPVDALVYATGIGRFLALPSLAGEADVIATNLVGLAITAEEAIPRMLAAGRGHLIGLSSQADRLIDPGAPSYAASKAGMSAYLEGLALAVRGRGVAVTNVRFGFVDTELSRAGGGPRPFCVTPERAARVVERALARRPIRVTYPWRMAPLVWLVGLPARLRARFG